MRGEYKMLQIIYIMYSLAYILYKYVSDKIHGGSFYMRLEEIEAHYTSKIS